FDGSDTWSVTIRTGKDSAAIPADTYDTLQRGLRALPEVRALGLAAYAPYTMSNWYTSIKSPQTGAEVETNILEAGDGFADAVGLRLVRGRWFLPSDEGAAVQPVVMDRRLAAAMFPGREALD